MDRTVKADNETLFLGLLLLYGGDPEPHLKHGTDIYRAWYKKVSDEIVKRSGDCGCGSGDCGCGYGCDKGMMEYIYWLKDRGLAWAGP